MAMVDTDFDAFVYSDLPMDPPAAWLAQTNLLSVFGMREMEWAAEEIIARCTRAGTWHIPFGLADFHTSAQAGFLQLIANGWLASISIVSKEMFILTPQFIERVSLPRRYTNEHGGWRPSR